MELNDGDDSEQELAEISDEDEDDFAQLDIEADDEDMFDDVAEFLAQIGDDDRTTLQSLVGQVLAEQYSDDGNILLAQAEGSTEVRES